MSARILRRRVTLFLHPYERSLPHIEGKRIGDALRLLSAQNRNSMRSLFHLFGGSALISKKHAAFFDEGHAIFRKRIQTGDGARAADVIPFAVSPFLRGFFGAAVQNLHAVQAERFDGDA